MAPGTVIQYEKDGRKKIIEEGLKPTEKLTAQLENHIKTEQENF